MLDEILDFFNNDHHPGDGDTLRYPHDTKLIIKMQC